MDLHPLTCNDMDGEVVVVYQTHDSLNSTVVFGTWCFCTNDLVQLTLREDHERFGYDSTSWGSGYVCLNGTYLCHVGEGDV